MKLSPRFTLVLWMLPLCAWAEPKSKPLVQQIEERGIARLAVVQASQPNALMPFVTDGCSGGLSSGWVMLGKALPVFQEKFGDKPPYEACCVSHDKAYWQGETAQGYVKRLQADAALRSCVAEYGKTHRAKFARDFNLSEEQIVTNFQFIADAMYEAVRFGGQPCTLFPWRWGYGWPLCPPEDNADTE